MVVAVAMAVAALAQSVGAQPLEMKPVGAFCGSDGTAGGCFESTPFLWKGQLHVAEQHSTFRIRRQALPGCTGTACDNSVVMGAVPGSKGVAFVSALVIGDTLWLFGTNDAAMAGGKSRTQVHAFWSKAPADASAWQTGMILQLPQGGVKPDTRYGRPL